MTNVLNHVAPTRKPAGATLQWSVICDFDGTVTFDDFIDRLLEQHADVAWRAVEEDWKAGRIGSRECLTRQIDMVRCSPVQLARLIGRMKIDPGFGSFVALCRQHALPLRIVSDGLDVAIRAILARHDLDNLPVFANRLEHRGKQRMRILFPQARDNCIAASGMCKCAQAEAAAGGPGGDRAQTLLIGDGASDFCLARAADFVFAKGRLAAYCAAENIPFAAFGDFFDICRLLTGLLQGNTQAAAQTIPVTEPA
ncbi:MAG: MtnX-like HAD-IB family phosphatase [Rhodospirillales bacterium]